MKRLVLILGFVDERRAALLEVAMLTRHLANLLRERDVLRRPSRIEERGRGDDGDNA